MRTSQRDVRSYPESGHSSAEPDVRFVPKADIQRGRGVSLAPEADVASFTRLAARPTPARAYNLCIALFSLLFRFKTNIYAIVHCTKVVMSNA